ncbi:uncharacterized protein LOC143035016 [Oratosquilla oratoria]|uniref:uncharacterized protein LOC143035016 n=1 Tax=Oratosquilla oratoria TaxID=337810 RepID=UPI003F771A20
MHGPWRTHNCYMQFSGLVTGKLQVQVKKIQKRLGMNLPLTSLPQIVDLEERLKDKAFKGNLIANLSILGGANTTEATNRILKALLTSELALQFNWMGRGEKSSFKALLLSDVVLGAVQKKKPIHIFCRS